MSKPTDRWEGLRQQVPLAEYPSDRVSLACDRCGRRGHYPKARLVAEHGPDAGLVSVLNHLSRDCSKHRDQPDGMSRCGAYYVELRAPPAH
jgi:hypothetical protein